MLLDSSSARASVLSVEQLWSCARGIGRNFAPPDSRVFNNWLCSHTKATAAGRCVVPDFATSRLWLLALCSPLPAFPLPLGRRTLPADRVKTGQRLAMEGLLWKKAWGRSYAAGTWNVRSAGDDAGRGASKHRYSKVPGLFATQFFVVRKEPIAALPPRRVPAGHQKSRWPSRTLQPGRRALPIPVHGST